MVAVAVAAVVAVEVEVVAVGAVVAAAEVVVMVVCKVIYLQDHFLKPLLHLFVVTLQSSTCLFNGTTSFLRDQE